MSKTLRVGNLALTTTNGQLEEYCAAFGVVSKVRVVESPLSGQGRGFGYVEMKSEAEAATCLAGLNDQEREGRKLVVASVTATEAKKYAGLK